MASEVFTPEIQGAGTNLFDPAEDEVEANFQYRLCLTSAVTRGGKEYELTNPLK